MVPSFALVALLLTSGAGIAFLLATIDLSLLQRSNGSRTSEMVRNNILFEFTYSERAVCSIVPIIVIFTKMDVLENRAFAQLLDRGMAPRDAKQEAPNQLKEIFQRDYLIRLQEVVPGQRSVQFRGKLAMLAIFDSRLGLFT